MKEDLQTIFTPAVKKTSSSGRLTLALQLDFFVRQN